MFATTFFKLNIEETNTETLRRRIFSVFEIIKNQSKSGGSPGDHLPTVRDSERQFDGGGQFK